MPHAKLRLSLATILLAIIIGAITFLPATAQNGKKDEPGNFDLKPGDHISILGNTLADRQQHDAWLEAILHSRFPQHQLTFRNLGFSGDELTIRLRSANFGSPDHWLGATKSDVVFAFFGYNESFAGSDGVDKFKKDLTTFIKDTLAKKYNGKSPPRLVLFSPIAHEKVNDPNLPDPGENNQRLELFTNAMAEVARENKVRFVDLFQATRELYAKAKQPLTINGVHLTKEGNRQLAEIIDGALFAKGTDRDAAKLEKIRQAQLDSNFTWFQRYRTTDGFSIYGGRADLRFGNYIDKKIQTNREVMQREMEILDAMTVNRDQRVWAVAQGGDLKVDDGNTPPFIPVITNKPGPLPGGKHVFLDGDEAIQKMTVHPKMEVKLFASEKQFPELVNPVQMSFDTKGRLWVAVWPTYPHWKPKQPMNDKLLVLEDTDGDGRADKCSVFADGLHNPTGFEFWNGGVLVAQAPDLMFLKDTKGTGTADVRQRVIHGLDSADTHHTANSFVLDPGGALYFQEGTFHHTQVETPWGPPARVANGAVFRYEPRAQKFDIYVAHGFANPHGHVFDRWGQDIVVDGTGANPYHGALFSGRVDFPRQHARPPQVYQQKTRPCPGMEYLSSKHFPEEFQGNLLVPNVIGFHGILQYQVFAQGSSLGAKEVSPPILSSTDPNFRPSDLRVGPDGAIYFLDWHNPIIGHMQHNLRDPSRDVEHGRIYRVTYKDRPLVKPTPIADEPIDKLLEVLKSPEDRVRYRARIELSGRKTEEVVAAAKKWVANLDKADPDFDHHMLEALWLHQNHNVVNVDLLQRVLALKDFRARAAATRVLCYWRDRVPEALEILKKLAGDEHGRVRLEAVRAASFFNQPEAVEIALISTEHPTDTYLDFVRNETLKTLEPYWKKALAQGRPLNLSSEAGARFFLSSINTDDLLKMKRSRAVYMEMLFRKGIRDEFRREALTGLSKQESKAEIRVLLDALQGQDGPKSRDESVAFDLVRLLASRPIQELTGARDDLEKLAVGAKDPVLRQLGYVALIAADQTADKAWDLANKSVAGLRDVLAAMPMIRDPGVRAGLYAKVEPLLQGLPKHLAGAASSKGTLGRYVRVELKGKRTLTLAEVEVLSEGRNVARQGKASQKNTGAGGDASKAIDGNTSGTYGNGGQTHTLENTPDPWWEVDLGAEHPIETIAIYNRTDGDLGKRLAGFTLKVLDGNRVVVFQKEKIPAPAVRVEFPFSGGNPESLVRRAAMLALTTVRGQETPTFQKLAAFVKNDVERHAALQAMSRIPTTYWPKEEAQPLLTTLLAQVKKIPEKERTGALALDTLQLAESLAGLLPLEQARAARKEIGELGVRVLRIGTVTDQMIYDKERLVVRAGKPVEFLFENTDLMPHNLVLIQPGSLEEIGNLAETTGTQPGAADRHFVPLSNKVLLASRLIQPRESQKLSFTAPTQPGVYPYVCTYPGHWRRMHGALYVVPDLDEYLADPETYLAKNPLPIKDELLKFNRPRKEWKLEELAPAVAEMGKEHGRSFASGKQMFTVASCVACHKLNGVGNDFAPDLSKLDPKLSLQDVLKDVLEPSARIHEKYQTWILVTGGDKVITGLIMEETPKLLKVIENPLVKAEPILLKASDIVERKKSANSVMPKGLLDKLTREEILDLIAYVHARGDQKHMYFQAGHGGHGGHKH
jgi:putative heme-binding domain-containing protein